MTPAKLFLFASFVRGVMPVGVAPWNAAEIAGCQIQFVDAAQGWMLCGYPGTLQSTHDGGKTWRREELPGTVAQSEGVPIRGRLQSPSRGWIAFNGTLFTKNDRGASWSSPLAIPLGTTRSQTLSIDVSPDQRMVAALAESADQPNDVALVTSDMGQSWKKHPFERGKFRKVAIGLDSTVFLIGAEGIMRSADGGDTWNGAQLINPVRSKSSYRMGRPMSSFFLGALGWLVYEDGYVLRTGDRGQTWEQVARPTQVWPANTWPGSFTIRFLTTEHGYQIGGDGLLRESHDSGFTWKVVPLDPEKVADISCYGLRTCYAVTNRARLLQIDAISPMVAR